MPLLPPLSNYDFLAPRRVVFGCGRWREVGPLAAAVGRRAFIVLGSRTLADNGFEEQLRGVLGERGVESVRLAAIRREPRVDDVDEAAARIRQHGAGTGDMVIGIGGGSAIDLAKAVAAMATTEPAVSVRDYLEGVGRGFSLSAPPLPVIVMPTTAGTGSEATKNAVISGVSPPFKKSLRADGLLPQTVVVDPELTVCVAPAITAATGMDAITQLIESYTSRKARPIAQALCEQGLPLALEAIVEAVEHGDARPAREAMSHAALLSGMALANSGLGMAHGVAAALGVHFDVPHGLACAVMLPAALRTNRDASQPQFARLARLSGLADGLADRKAADALIERIDDICQRIGVRRRLADLGVNRSDVAVLVRDSRGNSMDGNPRPVSDAELAQMLEALL